MAYTSIHFKHPVTGAMKKAPVGFSWTVFFFSWIPPLFRSDFKYAAIMLILACLTFGLSGFVFIFMYNKFYIKDLIGAGYKAVSIDDGNMAKASSKVGMEIPMFEAAPVAAPVGINAPATF